MSEFYPAHELTALARVRYPAWQGFEHAPFVADEVAPRREAARLAQTLLSRPALESLIQAAGFDDILARLEQLSRVTNLLWTAQPSRGDLALLYTPGLPQPAYYAHLFNLLHGVDPIEVRLDEYAAFLGRHALPNSWPLPTYLLSLLDPAAHIFVKPRLTHWFMQFMGAEAWYAATPSGAAYLAVVHQAQAIQAALADQGTPDLLAVQSLVWVAYQVSRERIGRLTLKDQVELNQPPDEEPAYRLAAGDDTPDYVIAAPEQHPMRSAEIAARLDRLFRTSVELEWAFSYLRAVILQLTQGQATPLLALTLPHKGRALSLDYGSWLVTRVYRRRKTGPLLLSMALLEASIPEEFARLRSEPFAATAHEPAVRIVWDITPEAVERLGSAQQATLDFIARRFEHWAGSPMTHRHQADIFEAVMSQVPRASVSDSPATAGADLKSTADTSVSGRYHLRDLSNDTCLTEEQLLTWVEAIHRKGQAVFYGPPGTGKTFVAQQLARHLVSGGDGLVELVQFHPAYAYEDFIQGIRPITRAGQLTYENRPGLFLDFCRRAAACRGVCVLIIDEINRADLARVLGELMYALEYRQVETPLAGGGSLRIPTNVRLLGTMNTADRSIALVDYALRRRFVFIPLRPNYEALRRYHAATGYPSEPLIEVLTALNQHLEPDYQVGVSYFLRRDLAETLPSIWQLEIEPYLEEYFYNQREAVEAWRWAEIARRVAAGR